MKIVLLILIFIFVSFSIPAMSSVTLTFKDGGKFVDYELTGENRKKSLKILTNDFQTLFDLLAKNYLTEDQKMEVTVTNIDLAGDIKFNQLSTGQKIRVLKDINFIRLYFDYQVKASDGELLKEGQYELKELTRSSSSGISINRFGRIKHFVKPLKNWFFVTFSK